MFWTFTSFQRFRLIDRRFSFLDLSFFLLFFFFFLLDATHHDILISNTLSINLWPGKLLLIWKRSILNQKFCSKSCRLFEGNVDMYSFQLWYGASSWNNGEKLSVGDFNLKKRQYTLKIALLDEVLVMATSYLVLVGGKWSEVGSIYISENWLLSMTLMLLDRLIIPTTGLGSVTLINP